MYACACAIVTASHCACRSPPPHSLLREDTWPPLFCVIRFVRRDKRLDVALKRRLGTQQAMRAGVKPPAQVRAVAQENVDDR